jgi:general nucleoside transport system permease protein
MIRLQPRLHTAKWLDWASPLMAIVLTLLVSSVMFWVLGTDPIEALQVFFIQPVSSLYGVSELLLKATPLILIGIGLSFGFRAGIWNIGAEGQLVMGGVAAGAVALALSDVNSSWILVLMALAGVLGGMAWGALPALLRTRFNTNEILTSLMLTYVAGLFLSLMVHGPLKDPDGFNFPESALFHDAALLPVLFDQGRAHIGFILALILAPVASYLFARHLLGFQLRLQGQAPKAARFAGFSESRMVWTAFLLGGGLAGLAGMMEVSGSVGQLVPVISPGYGFTAIIVAFLGRLHPVGIVPAGLLMALSYMGGEAAQISLSLPNAVTGVFQGMLLFFLLGSAVISQYRIVWGRN